MATAAENFHITVPSPIAQDPTLIPSTTFPAAAATAASATTSTANPSNTNNNDDNDSPHSVPGPLISGRKTILTRYEPHHLPGLPLLEPLWRMINRSFSHSHAHAHHREFNSPAAGGSARSLLPASLNRLDTPAEFLAQTGADPGTFVFVVAFAEDDDEAGMPVATAGAHRYVAPVLMAVEGGGEEGGRKVFQRVGLPPMKWREGAREGEAREYWELKLMAVDTAAQGQGVAGLLMRMVDAEVLRRVRGRRRFDASPSLSDGAATEDRTSGPSGSFFSGAATAGSGEAGEGVCMLLTTIKEINGGFYARRGYVEDYAEEFGPGTLGSEGGFTVVHMSRVMGG